MTNIIAPVGDGAIDVPKTNGACYTHGYGTPLLLVILSGAREGACEFLLKSKDLSQRLSCVIWGGCNPSIFLF